MRPRLHLSKNQVERLVSANAYKVPEKNRNISRCIDGRYPNSPDLPALSLHGADGGELALLYATGTIYGFEIDLKKASTILTELVGGVKNISYTDPKEYNLEKEGLEIVKKYLEELKSQGAMEVKLEGNHLEGAALIVKGQYGVLPQYMLDTDSGNVSTQVFVYQQTLVNERHRLLANELVEKKAVKLYDNLDQEYLYEVLSNTCDDHFFETVKRVGATLPLFEVTFAEDGSFEVVDLGFI